MITKQNVILQSFLDSPAYELLEQIKEDTIKKWQNEPIIGNDAFSTVRNALRREYKIEALKEFFNYLNA